MKELSMRQVHMDFHTHGSIPDVGGEFDPVDFADTLRSAGVTSINLFSRGHHGWLYYYSKRFAERQHPHLKCNLLLEQVKACKQAGIRTAIYIPIQWDYQIADEHPEWLVVDEMGTPVVHENDSSYFKPGFYRNLCLNTPFTELAKEYIRDVLENIPCDGLWLDVVWPMPCACKRCRDGMIREGIDPSVYENRVKYGTWVYESFLSDVYSFIKGLRSDCDIVFHSPESYDFVRFGMQYKDILEWEGLPSAVGYDHYPITIRYVRNFRENCVSLIGKFQTVWGDFHSYRKQEMLEFECFRILSLCGKCSVGDHLYPTGKIDHETYRLIGSVYNKIADVEPWCRNAKPVCDTAVVTPWAGNPTIPSVVASNRMLQELACQFDFIDPDMDLNLYRLIILPDDVEVDSAFANKIDRYLDQGGSVILSGKSGINPETGDFFGRAGIHYKGPARYTTDFIAPSESLSADLPAGEYVMYTGGEEVEAREETDTLAMIHRPFFNRTWEHFMSHRHAPSTGEAVYPAVTQSGRCIYLAHPVFTLYKTWGMWWCKTLVRQVIDRLIPDTLVRHNGPSTLLVTLNRQEEEHRLVLHLLHYIPQKKCDKMEIVEDVIPVYRIKMSVHCDEKPHSIHMVPHGTELPFTYQDRYSCFEVPEIDGHLLVEIS